MVPQIVRMAAEAGDVAADLLGKQTASATPPPADRASTETGRDLGKKKRTNRSAKLKQWKIDARREQWLSLVKDKGRKYASGESSSSTERSRSPENSSGGFVGDRNEELHDSDFESSMNSSGVSMAVSGQLSSKPIRISTSRVSSTSIGDSFSGGSSVSDDDDNASFDDWEAVADALNMDGLQKQTIEPSAVESVGSDSPLSNVSSLKNSAIFSSEGTGQDVLRPEYKGKPSCFEKNRTGLPVTCRAWCPDDASRPSSLPTLSKQMSFPSVTDRQRAWGSVILGSFGTNSSMPTSCPICYEDLDVTDSSFIPCCCGFRLCLFCHKRILEDDGRCPGCRKQYGPLEDHKKEGPPLTYLSRSCSMHMRS